MTRTLRSILGSITAPRFLEPLGDVKNSWASWKTLSARFLGPLDIETLPLVISLDAACIRVLAQLGLQWRLAWQCARKAA